MSLGIKSLFAALLLILSGCTADSDGDQGATSGPTLPESTLTTPSSPPPDPSSTMMIAPAGIESGSIVAMSDPEDDIRIAEPTPLGASMLTASPDCSETEPGRAFVDLSWDAAETGEQRLDFTWFFQGFEAGDFVSTPMLPREQATYHLLDPEPGIQYRWRVLTSVDQVWVTSQVSTFQATTCVVDTP